MENKNISSLEGKNNSINEENNQDIVKIVN